MLVTNLQSPSGNAVANQYAITEGGKYIFQSYQTKIMSVDCASGEVLIDDYAFDYSRTTTKYIRQFIKAFSGFAENDLKKAIKENVVTVNNWTIKAVRGLW